MHRRILIVGLALFVACKKKSPPPPPPPAPTPIAAPVVQVPEPPVPMPAVDPIAPVDAAQPVALDTEVDRYLNAYLDLLWADFWLAEMLKSYPGVPESRRYLSVSYKWELPDRAKMEAAFKVGAQAAANAEPQTATDRAVHAYISAVVKSWDRLDDLATYYADQKFVDDEFERGHRDKDVVASARAAIAPLRMPMIEAVFAGWRTVAGDKPASARAVLGAAWEACTRVAIAIYMRPPETTGSARTPAQVAADDALDKKMSECRRGVGSVSALPTAYRSFDRTLREAAIGFGDAMAADWARKYAVDQVATLVKAYIKVWPQLPAVPAEKEP